MDNINILFIALHGWSSYKHTLYNIKLIKNSYFNEWSSCIIKPIRSFCCTAYKSIQSIFIDIFIFMCIYIYINLYARLYTYGTALVKAIRNEQKWQESEEEAKKEKMTTKNISEKFHQNFICYYLLFIV